MREQWGGGGDTVNLANDVFEKFSVFVFSVFFCDLNWIRKQRIFLIAIVNKSIFGFLFCRIVTSRQNKAKKEEE